MHETDERLMAHARALRARGTALPPEGPPGSEILDSWVRCAAAGLAFEATPEMIVVADPELQRRRDAAGIVRRLALAEIETLQQQIAGSNFLLAFGDRDGVILDLYADHRFAAGSSDAGILCGSLWSEARCGTNGIGSALATGRPMAVSGLEHYFFKYGGIACTAAPVRDAYGEVVGVLDAASQYQSRQRHTLALLQMSATHIENVLLARQMRGRLVVAMHPRAEFLGTLSAGLFAFDGDGRLAAVNARGRQLLSGLDAAPGTPFERLFDARFDQVAARLAQGGELRLTDALGSALMASAIGAAAPAPMPLAALPAVAPRPVRSNGWPVAGSAPQQVTPHSAHAAHHGPRTPGARWSDPPIPQARFVAQDPAVRDAVAWVESAVRRSMPVLIQGETGTGKEMLARHAHEASGRSGAFVAVNCAAMPAELFEAELFGYAGGAFTGARREGGAGLIQSADGGTLLLDELGDMPIGLQAALLRFLDDQLVRPVGGTQARRVDVQLLAATNTDLQQAVAERRFRADLLYRLNTVSVEMPPLRARADFAAVLRHVLHQIEPRAAIDDAAVAALAAHRWPGNIRELRSLLTRLLLRPGASGEIRLADLRAGWPAGPAGAGIGDPEASALQRGATDAVQREFERCRGSVAQTSRNLGISRTTVYRHLRVAGVRP